MGKKKGVKRTDTILCTLNERPEHQARQHDQQIGNLVLMVIPLSCLIVKKVEQDPLA